MVRISPAAVIKTDSHAGLWASSMAFDQKVREFIGNAQFEVWHVVCSGGQWISVWGFGAVPSVGMDPYVVSLISLVGMRGWP